MINDSTNYRAFLKSELAARSDRNGAYSISAFARLLGVGRSFLSEVLAGKKNLSLEAAMNIARKLNLTASDASYFLSLVRLARVDDHETRESILDDVRSSRPGGEAQDLSIDLFKSIAEWYHLAILELTYLTGFDLTPQNSAKRLKISILEAQSAIDRLLRLELLEKDRAGRYRKATPNYLLVHAKTPEEAVQRFHRHILEKAAMAVSSQSKTERIGRSELLPIDRKLLPQAEAILDRAAAELHQLSRLSKSKTDVYSASIQFFNLTPDRKTP